MVRDLPTGRLKLRLFLVRAMLGHRSRPGGILPAKSIPRNGLRDGRRKLERPRLAETLSAQLLAKSHAPQRAHDSTIRSVCNMAVCSPDQARGEAHGMELKRLRIGLRIFAGGTATFVDRRCLTVKRCRS